jgi:release factor glutamine methyltransferase
VDTPRLDAELLLAEATAIDRAGLVVGRDSGLEPAAARRFAEMVRRRVRREPVAYILGRKGFRGIELAVDPRALIPRPETELLVEIALQIRPKTVLDIGTGSGAVALAVADELPDAEVLATDTSPDALQLARQNAARLGLTERVRFEVGSVPSGRFDLTLANLPYVAEAEWSGLAPEIADYEPREALVSGVDGLDAIRWIAPRIHTRFLALEVGAGQAQAVIALVEEAGFEGLETRSDLAGIERVVVGRKEDSAR